MASYPLQQALEEHCNFTKRLFSLHNDTSKWLARIQTRLELEDEISFPMTEMEKVEIALRKTPSVIFIGNRNCGKSSLLNELLRGTYVPVHENPCTSRIVRIKFSKENFVKLVSRDGNVLQPPKQFKKNVPKELVVLSEEDKEDPEKLMAVVEVGLSHELLSSGIELIDCPGKNENIALDGVVEDFLTKGTVPLVVYIVDGNLGLRPTVSSFVLVYTQGNVQLCVCVRVRVPVRVSRKKEN